MHSKAEIKSWLKKNGKNRVWLADRLGVSKATVDKYLSTNVPIPEKSMKIIDFLFSETNDCQTVKLLIPDDFISLVQTEAARMHQSIDEFCASLIFHVLGDTPPIPITRPQEPDNNA